MPSILTPLQAEVLRLFFESQAAGAGYFLTGGTALSEFYLHHRSSEDLDFFSRTPRNLAEDASAFAEVLAASGIHSRNVTADPRFSRLVAFRGPDNEVKVDLAEDKIQLAPTLSFGGVVVDSLEDIAVNKVCVLSRLELKDFVDLYMILAETDWTLDYLLDRAKLKEGSFEEPRTLLRFADDLTRCRAVDLPLFMRKPIDMSRMKSRLLAEANKIRLRFAPRD